MVSCQLKSEIASKDKKAKNLRKLRLSNGTSMTTKTIDQLADNSLDDHDVAQGRMGPQTLLSLRVPRNNANVVLKSLRATKTMQEKMSEYIISANYIST